MTDLRSTIQRTLRRLSVTACVAMATFVGIEAIAQDIQMTEEQFNSWLTSGNESPEDQAKSQAEMELKEITRICGLAEIQRVKLELAAQGDADRFETSIAQLRDEIVGKTYDQNEIGEVYQRIQPYALRCQQGLLGDDSLFRKCLISTLNDDQYAKYGEAQFRRRCVSYDAKVRLYVGLLERSLPMTHKQRTHLVEHLLANTFPPKRFGSQDLYYVMAQVSKAPLDELEDDFDEAQLKLLRAAFNQGRAYDQFTRQQGYEPDDRRAPLKNYEQQPAASDADDKQDVAAQEST